MIFYLAPIDKGSKIEELVIGIRTRKGLKKCASRTSTASWSLESFSHLLSSPWPEIPSLDQYYDKL